MHPTQQAMFQRRSTKKDQVCKNASDAKFRIHFPWNMNMFFLQRTALLLPFLLAPLGCSSFFSDSMLEDQESNIFWILGSPEFNPTVTDLISIDIDGDGLDDVVTDRHIFLGSSLHNRTEIQSSSADIVFTDVNYLPENTKNAGDIDGDGLDDVFVFGADPTVGVKGYLFLSSSLSTGTVLVETADIRFEESTHNDISACNMTSLGDIDGDGLGDIMISVPSAPGLTNPFGEMYYHTGRVYVFLGSQLINGNLRYLEEAQYTLVGYEHTYIGEQLTTVNAAVLISASGSQHSWLNNTDCTGSRWITFADLLGLSPGVHHLKDVSTLITYPDDTGYCSIHSFSGVDFHGDGTISPLLLDGAYTSDVHLGRFFTGGVRLSTEHGISHIFEGAAVSGRGDFDGDGQGDIWVSDGYSEKGNGYLFLSRSSWSTTEVIASEADMNWTGNSGYRLVPRVSFAGDLNSDGCDELAIARKDKTTGVFDLGIVYGCLD